MAAPFTRSNLGRGPGYATFGTANFWTRGDIVPEITPKWDPVETSLYGEIDQAITDRIFKVNLPLVGLWTNLTALFPSAIINPTVGTQIFGSTDTSLVVLGRNGDQITFTNAALTKLTDLSLGVNAEIFSADAEFTCIKSNTANPEDANAYYTIATSQTYTDNAFSKSTYLRARWTGAWGSLTGFTSFVAQKGWKISWTIELEPMPIDGWGTCDMTLKSFAGTCKAIPIVPTLAQLEAQVQAQGVALGSLLSAASADLTLSAGTHSVVLKSAGIQQHGYAFGVAPLRIGEVTWRTTRGFTAGAPAAIATVA